MVAAFALVLAEHGYAGATIAAIASKAGVAPGLVHHHFEDKEELLSALLQDLLARFRERLKHYEQQDRLLAYVDGALKLDQRADIVAARCWVGLFSEALRSPSLFKQVRRLIDSEVSAIRARSNQQLSEQEASAVLAFIIGSLVVGAFAPQKAAGFAAPGLTRLIAALRGGLGQVPSH